MTGQIAMTVLAVAATLTFSACSTGSNKFQNLDPQTQAAHHGTQSGYHRIGTHFVASVDGGKWNQRLMKFYYYPTGNGRKELIGITSATLLDGADYGSQQAHFAVSADGASILFFHEAALGYGKITNAQDGLYLYDRGAGAQWIRPIGDHVIDPTEIDRYLSTN